GDRRGGSTASGVQSRPADEDGASVRTMLKRHTLIAYSRRMMVPKVRRPWLQPPFAGVLTAAVVLFISAVAAVAQDPQSPLPVPRPVPSPAAPAVTPPAPAAPAMPEPS